MTDAAATRGRPRWRSRLRWTVRTRVLAALTALSALALLVAGTTAYVLERQRVDEVIQNTLERSSAEFLTLAEEGVDPKTGEPFHDVSELLIVALGRIVPAPNEGMTTFVEGRPFYNQPDEYPYHVQDDAELMAALAPMTQQRAELGRSLITTIDTAASSYRVAIVPVTGPSGTSGALVLAYDRSAEHSSLAQNYRTYALVALGAVLLIGLLGFLIVSDLLKPVALLRSAASQISSSDLSRRIKVVGNDDLAVLTQTVNGMLDRLEHAFSSQRQLLDDVGHELRTPLTVVRGHLELMDPDDPEDAAATRALALDELDRMNSLVEELVTLAKSSRPDFVTPRPSDLAVLTDEVLIKARPLGERQWTLDALAEDCVVDLDQHRITQAWLQLANNAVKFSEPGSTVAIGSSADETSARLWVRDEGVGIAPQDQQRVFDRFARAETGVEGSGLGLTIVRSIANAHGGTVEVRSALGRGSMFTIVLPRQAATDETTEGEGR
jgi:two-component system OmpR family sensor kinase